jgi:hypothetical protein
MLDPSLRRWCERVSAARRHRRGDAETAVVNAWITLPQGFLMSNFSSIGVSVYEITRD